jgi:hypothetical protein
VTQTATVLRCTVFVAAAFVVGILAPVPAGAAGCALRAGAKVMLRSSDFDPDVFVWDTQGRAIGYAARAPFMKVDEVLAHIVLAKPGTHAVVVGCSAGVVRPRFTAAVQDALLVRLASGSNRGHLGWVASGDVRV